jgi:hypothetical protein
MFGAQHAGLPSAVGMASEEDWTLRQISQRRDGVLQSGAVAFAIIRSRRPVGTILTEWQVAAQDEKSYLGKSFRQRNQ